MRKNIALSSISIGLVLLAVSFVHAQDTGTTSSIYCPNLSVTLQFGSRDAATGGQVTELQKFISDYYDLNPSDYVTGYFGRLTRDNVRRFQCEQMGICSGDEASTGWGVVGPHSRAVIAQKCGGGSTTNTNSPLPPSNPVPPTCTLNLNPSTIMVGQPSTLIWSSTNATQGYVSSIGTVSANGSQSISSTFSITYYGSFWGSGGTAQCSATLTVSTETGHSPCSFNNQSIPDGQSVTAWQSSTVAYGSECVSQTRICHNGTLDGTYQYASCSVAAATCTPAQPQTQTLSCPTGQTGSITQTRTSTCATGATAPTWGEWHTTSNTCVATNTGNASCTLDGVTLASGQSATFYSASTVQSPNTCSSVAQTRTCTNGVLSGSSTFNKARCEVTTASGSCLVGSTTYPNGANVPISTWCSLRGGCPAGEVWPGGVFPTAEVCTNGSWVPLSGPACTSDPTSPQTQTLSCPAGQTGSITQTRTSSCAAGATAPTWSEWHTTSNTCATTTAGTTGQNTLTVTPTSGAAPLTIGVSSKIYNNAANENAGYIDYGDGTRTSPPGGCNIDANGRYCAWGGTQMNHTYSFSGTYTVTMLYYPSLAVAASATVTVTGGTTTSAPFVVGDRVQLLQPLAVFSSSTYLGGQPAGALGTIVEGPYEGATNWNYKIDFDTGVDGWIPVVKTTVESYIKKVTGTTGGTTASNVGSCTYKGQTYAEGQSAPIEAPYTSSPKCDNGTWAFYGNNQYSVQIPSDFCDGNRPNLAYFGCGPYDSTKVQIVVNRYHGAAPLSVNVLSSPGSALGPNDTSVRINWGDGVTDPGSLIPGSDFRSNTHTYNNPGSYVLTVSATGRTSKTANIRVDGTVASAQNQSQLASALVALEGALQTLLKLLGQ